MSVKVVCVPVADVSDRSHLCPDEFWHIAIIEIRFAGYFDVVSGVGGGSIGLLDAFVHRLGYW